MLFNSVEFLFIFLPVVLGIFHYLNRKNYGQSAVAFLGMASLVFYAWWDPRYVVLLLGSIAWNWWCGAQILKRPTKRMLGLGIAVDMLALAYFKYANFFADTAMSLTGQDWQLQKVILPLGISFFTFTQIAFLVDAYRGKVKESGRLNYILFVTFFPHLIAGPVLHHGEMMPQFAALQGKKPQASVVAGGIFLLCIGLFKKLVIADSLAAYADPAFANVSVLQILDAWTATVAYTLQLYFDFSAYSEMAMGIAMLFGIHLPLNFNSPYKASNIADFWKRWHMTLSRFLRDYLYIPLGGNRHGFGRMLVALWMTMLLGGLWHGAGWTFIVWGLMHGTMLAMHRVWSKFIPPMNEWAARVLTMLFVMFAWVMFRANTVEDALTIWRKMVGMEGVVLPPLFKQLGLNVATAISPTINGVEILIMCVVLVFCMTQKNVHEVWSDWSQRPRRRQAASLFAVWAVSFFSLNKVSSFLYWAF